MICESCFHTITVSSETFGDKKLEKKKMAGSIGKPSAASVDASAARKNAAPKLQ